MTHYEEHIKPLLHADPQWQALVRQVEQAKEKLAQLETARINYETAFVTKRAYV